MYCYILFILIGLSLLVDKKYKLQDEKSIKTFGFSHIYHLYFAIATSFFTNEIETRNIGILYFILDILVQYYKKCLTTFTICHHSLTIVTQLPTFSIVNSNYNELLYIYNIFRWQEISNIILNSYLLLLIPESIYKILFPLTLIYFRVIKFNIDIFNSKFTIYLTIISIFMNIINSYILYRMFLRIKKYLL